MQQNQRVFQLSRHFIGIGDEVRRQITAVKLHAFHNVQFAVQAFGFLNRDDAFIADLIHRFGNHGANLGFAIGRDCADLGNLIIGFDFFGTLFNIAQSRRSRLFNTTFQIHRVHAGGNRFMAFADNCLRQNRGGCGAVTGDIIGARSHFADHLRAHVFKLIFQLDFFGNRYTVFGGARCAKCFIKHNIAAFRAQRHFHGIGKNVDTFQHFIAGF